MRIRSLSRHLPLWVLAGVVLMPTVTRAGEATIRRDEWGVPHIFAATLPDGCYAMGYAQAEDRLAQIMINYRLAIGRMAEVAGPGMVEQDWQARLVGNEAVCRRRYNEVPADVRACLESFTAGVKAYMAEHPDKVPDGALDIEPWMIAALGRLIIFNWPLGQAMDELGKRSEVHFFSNEWAVRPERTADNAAILLTDPHIPWDGPFRFYEFRMHAGGVDASGFAPVGAPTVGLGHNAFLGWACTTGGPDTTDVFVEELDPNDPNKYHYDNEWRDITSEEVTIQVKGAAPVTRKLERTHHGPILLREGNKAYSLGCPYLDEIGLIEQLYRMMTARNLAEFNAALGLNQLMEQNVMYADVEGNIQYVRTGRVPIRPDGFDYSKPVPGNTSKSEWLGIHPMADLVQVLNPKTGYLQNCNIGPDMMAKDLGLDPNAYPSYIYGDTPGHTNSRGRRAVELLEQYDKLTIEQAQAIVLDTHADGCERWRDALLQAVKDVDLDALLGPEIAGYVRQGMTLVDDWDGHMDQDSVVATWYRALRETCKRDGFELGDQPLSRAQEQHLIELLVRMGQELMDRYGTVEIPYGMVHRVRRGNKSWPISGGESGGGMTLRAVGANEENGVWYGRTGQNWVQLIQFRPGAVQSWTVNPYGESDDPASPHFTDQAEKLFSQGKLKPSWFQPADLQGHIESEKVLQVP